jgi:hypothetical protein
MNSTGSCYRNSRIPDGMFVEVVDPRCDALKKPKRFPLSQVLRRELSNKNIDRIDCCDRSVPEVKAYFCLRAGFIKFSRSAWGNSMPISNRTFISGSLTGFRDESVLIDEFRG